MIDNHRQVTHKSLRQYIFQICEPFLGPSTNRVKAYLSKRAEKEGTSQQDLLPSHVYIGVGGLAISQARALAAIWTLYLASSHILDAIQDKQSSSSTADSIFALALANLILAKLEVDRDTLSDILNALSQVTVMGMIAQEKELQTGRAWSRQDYFRNVLGKSASIIATGTWLGGRLATDDEQTLYLLREFGLALGMAMQLSDDCLDLEEDLANGTFTLPVLEGLALVKHPENEVLRNLVESTPLSVVQVQTIVEILERMGTITATKRLVRAYQVQAAAIFEVLPGLEPYFAEYVRPAN